MATRNTVLENPVHRCAVDGKDRSIARHTNPVVVATPSPMGRRLAVIFWVNSPIIMTVENSSDRDMRAAGLALLTVSEPFVFPYLAGGAGVHLVHGPRPTAPDTSKPWSCLICR